MAGLQLRLHIREPLVMNGITRKWFNDFVGYWRDVLGGRPLHTIADFNALLHDYRKGQQHVAELDWSDPSRHIAVWQESEHIYQIFHSARKLALHPTVGHRLWAKVPRGSRVLEYGCSLAPYYYCYRSYFSHLGCTFVLADLANYPFHYAKYLYRHDAEVEFATINAEDFADPLGSVSSGSGEVFDVIVVTTVFEHVDDPMFVASYLLDRLKPGGLFVFDYIKSDGHGLDHPNALRMRGPTLTAILDRTDVIHGEVDDLTASIDLCIARKSNSQR